MSSDCESSIRNIRVLTLSHPTAFSRSLQSTWSCPLYLASMGVPLGAVLGPILMFCLYVWMPEVSSHGTLIDPPSRASMWRFGFDTPVDYQDMESWCGGFGRQWVKNKGKCGLCGDPWDTKQPREHEAGGKYGLGIIVRRYKVSTTITVQVNLTACHMGHFEFRLCPHNRPRVVANQTCLDRHVLLKAKSSDGEKDHPTWYYVGESKVYKMRYVLPKNLTCSQCVFQWIYKAANNWGKCNETFSAMGCGPQEQFRGCADVAIEDKPIKPIDEDPEDNEVDTGAEDGAKDKDKVDDSDESLLKSFGAFRVL